MQNAQRRRSPLPLLSAGAALAAAAAVVALPALGARDTRGPIPGTGCGGTLWHQMALSDDDAGKVLLSPQETTIGAIAELKPPPRIASSRSSLFQRAAWHVHAVIDRYRIATNGEIVLILYSIDTNQYMDAYMPNPRCLTPKTRNRAAILAARQIFRQHCPIPTTQWQLSGTSAEVTGVGFWNPVHTTRGALANGAELRPVTNFVIDSGCGVS
jgi:hypothetical protein